MDVRGLFYSILTLTVLITIVVYTINYLNSVRTESEEVTNRIRGTELSNYLDSIYLDLPRFMLISCKRAIAGATNFIVTNNTPIREGEAERRLKELLLNRTIYGNFSNFTNQSSFPEWIAKIEEIGRKYGFETNITVTENDMNITPYDSFHLNFSVTLHIRITDTRGDMNISRDYNQSILVPIYDFEDPIYALNSYGFVNRIIKKSDIYIWNVSALDYAISNEFYMNCSDGPSFFDRLENRANESRYAGGVQNQIGLESFVNINDFERLRNLGYNVSLKYNSSLVDHYYFNATTPCGYNVSDLNATWFRIDNVTHAEQYGVRDALRGEEC